MLVIRRKPGETVLIGDSIEVEILDASPNRVTIGIRAPADVLVLRKEILIARSENQAAARALPPELLDSILSRFQQRER